MVVRVGAGVGSFTTPICVSTECPAPYRPANTVYAIEGDRDRDHDDGGHHDRDRDHLLSLFFHSSNKAIIMNVL